MPLFDNDMLWLTTRKGGGGLEEVSAFEQRIIEEYN